MATIPAYTINGITRPELTLDGFGNIVLDDVASAFVQAYGLKALYIGCPPSTPYPPVPDSVSTPVDANAAANSVVEGAAANTLVNLKASATSTAGLPVKYSLTADSSGGGFKIDADTGVVSVADSSKIDFETTVGHAYTVTVRANDGLLSSSQTFTIGVTDVAPSTPTGASGSVAEGATIGTAVGITASSTDINGPGVKYTLTDEHSRSTPQAAWSPSPMPARSTSRVPAAAIPSRCRRATTRF